MKQKSQIILLITSIFFCGILNAQSIAYYQLKVYSFADSAQLKRTEAFLQKAYIPAAHRAGISKIGVFKPNEPDTSVHRLVYVLIPFKSLDQFEKLPGILAADKQFQIDGTDYLDANFDDSPYQRIECILLKSFKGMQEIGIPVHSTPPSKRVYELRSYQGATEKIFQRKVDMFNEGGEINLFKELGFNPVFFGEVVSGDSMPNLMYLTTFSDADSRKSHWNSFQNHPKWKELKEVEKYKNTVSKIDIYFLHPADYSDL
jgi:hypothetical protein